MIETNISITVNRKSDFNLIEQKIIEHKIRFPVYMREYEHHYQIDFTSDYEEWELDTAILQCFSEYTYVTDLGRGGDEIRLEISRYQSGYSADGWDRLIENPLNETKYLVKKSTEKQEEFNPKIKVLFENEERYYYVNMVGRIKKSTEEHGFLLQNDFKAKVGDDDNTEILYEKFYPSTSEAFDWGYYKLQSVVEEDFALYQQEKKKAERDLQKPFRKIIRDFIKACNQSDEQGILKDLHKDIFYQEQKDGRLTAETIGLNGFIEFLDNFYMALCNKNFTIRSTWDFKLPKVIIGVKYFPDATNQEAKPFQKYGRIHFVFNEDKIIRIINTY